MDDMWRELVQARDATANFSQGVTVPAIAQAEQSLHLTLPADLRTLLLETDGISGEYGPHYVWSLATIVRENLAIYQTELDWFHAMPLDHLLFFANAGVDGILFAFPIWQQGIPSPVPVYAWYPLEDKRIRLARSLAEYLTGWLEGTLSV